MTAMLGTGSPEPTPSGLRVARADLLAADLAPAVLREQLVALHDAWLEALVVGAAVVGAAVVGAAGVGAGDQLGGFALVAVGGYGRRELLPGSDLDLLLLHDGRRPGGVVAETADRIWYPVWDSGVSLDHAVRTPDEAVRIADVDLKVMLGLLDLRHLAGDPTIAEQLRGAARSRWRAGAGIRVPALAEMGRSRAAEHGELAFLLEPDLRNARGGLRDLLGLRALALAQVADPPAEQVRAAAELLLDVRTVLHVRTAGHGRAADVLVLQEQQAVAVALGYPDADALMHEVAAAGRLVGHQLDTTWRRVLAALAPSPRRRFGLGARPRPVAVRPLAGGVVARDGEVALAVGADPVADPALVLRTAAAAAVEGLPLAPTTLRRLADAAPGMPVPWPADARSSLIELLGAGPPMVGVWEALDFAGVVGALLPEWEHTRSRPQRNAFHRYTVDRHLLETVAVAATLTREVARPDLLLLGALLHDIGKGLPGDHSEAGVGLVRRIGPRLGLSDDDTDTVVALVEHHLLLADTAARRDPDDPATAAAVAAAVGDRERLHLLHALTVADSQATGPSMWSAWKAGQLTDLVSRTARILDGHPPAPAAPFTAAERALLDEPGLVVHRSPGEGVQVLTVAQDDDPGLLAGLAAVLTVHRLDVRRLTVRVEGERALTVAEVRLLFGAPDWELLADDLRRVLDGRLDLADRLVRRDADTPAPRAAVLVPPPTVRVLDGDVSRRATVVQVRARSRPGLLHDVAAALVDAGLVIRTALVSTLGAEAVDTFYVLGPDGGPVCDPDQEQALSDRVLAAVSR